MALRTVRDLVSLVSSGHSDGYRKSHLQAVKAFHVLCVGPLWVMYLVTTSACPSLSWGCFLEVHLFLTDT